MDTGFPDPAINRRAHFWARNCRVIDTESLDPATTGRTINGRTTAELWTQNLQTQQPIVAPFMDTQWQSYGHRIPRTRHQ